jgi:hypothetical protein
VPTSVRDHPRELHRTKAGTGSFHLKINRAIATRYDQLAESFLLGMLFIASARYWIKFVRRTSANICGPLLPKMRPNSLGNAGTETDGERQKIREVPIKWYFLGKNKTRRQSENFKTSVLDHLAPLSVLRINGSAI